MTSIMDTVIAIGGLMRCCIATIDLLAAESPDMDVTEGQIATCRYADGDPAHNMIYKNGAWRWDHPRTRDSDRNLFDCVLTDAKDI